MFTNVTTTNGKILPLSCKWHRIKASQFKVSTAATLPDFLITENSRVCFTKRSHLICRSRRSQFICSSCCRDTGDITIRLADAANSEPGVKAQLLMVSVSHLQTENGCILNTSYPSGCAMPNGAVPGTVPAPPAVQVTVPETLPSLPDPPVTGFYLWPRDQEQACSRTLEQPYTCRRHSQRRRRGPTLCSFTFWLQVIVVQCLESYYHTSSLFTSMQWRVISLFKEAEKEIWVIKFYKSAFRYTVRHHLDPIQSVLFIISMWCIVLFWMRK